MVRVFLVLVLGAGLCTAQLSSTVGPAQAPLGSPIMIAISNDTSNMEVTGICPYNVTDMTGALVLLPGCPSIGLLLQPGQTFHTTWDQLDGGGVQVPPGTYIIRVLLPDQTTEIHTVAIGGVEMGLAHMGVPRVGTHRNLQVSAPGEAGRPFLMAAALGGATGFQTCNGLVSLDPDPLFYYSIQPNPVFIGFSGFLDSQGVSTAPSLNIPSLPGLAGATVLIGGLTYDPLAATCPIRAIAPPLVVTVL